MGRITENRTEVRDAWPSDEHEEGSQEEGPNDILLWVGVALGIIAVLIVLLFALNWWIGPQ